MSVVVSRRRVAIYLDVLLLVGMLLLYTPRGTGLPLHEWLGMVVALAVLVHLLLSWPWISAGVRAFRTAARPRSRVNVVLNLLLFILFVLEITSGLVISNVALPSLGFPTLNDRAWRAVHNLSLNWTLLLLGLHVAMNWHPLRVGVRRYFAPAEPAGE